MIHIILKNIIKYMHLNLEKEMKENWDRSVSFGDLIDNRWDRAKRLGFGEGSSIYNNVLVLGDVQIGKHTWIGPNVILDGSGGRLLIGDHCAISAGTQIYTHNVVKRCISLGEHPIEHAPTNIGNGVFIGPNCVISMGVSIGNKAVIGAMSFVNKNVPSGAKVWGAPATTKKKSLE